MKRCEKCKSERIRRVQVAETLTVGKAEFDGTVDGFRCEACGEEYLDGPDTGRFELMVAAWLAEHGVATREAFRFMRKAIGLSAAELAGLLDVTPETVSHWETGKREVPRNAVALLESVVLEHSGGSTTTLDRLRILREGPKVAKPMRIRLVRAANA
jgi:putative zinc finger/helix-turn-helix YgiT family protein